MFFHKRKEKEQKKGLDTEFVKSLDLDTSFEDVFGEEAPEETTFYNLDGTPAEIAGGRTNEQRK